MSKPLTKGQRIAAKHLGDASESSRLAADIDAAIKLAEDAHNQKTQTSRKQLLRVVDARLEVVTQAREVVAFGTDRMSRKQELSVIALKRALSDLDKANQGGAA